MTTASISRKSDEAGASPLASVSSGAARIKGPNLDTLTRAEASALQQIAQAAVRSFRIDRDNARLRLEAGGSDRWQDQARGEIADAQRLEAAARAFEKAAHMQALHAGIIEARAIRAIETLAMLTCGEPYQPGRIAA